jgi:uncharacterized membrane protein YqjE
MWRVSTDQQPDRSDSPRFEPAVPSIPLVDDSVHSTGIPASSVNGQSIGGLVRDASTQLSTLVRAEVELAKSEVTTEVKKGVKGSVFFVVALTIVLFSLFFFFIAIAEALRDLTFLPRSACYSIVFVFMLLLAGLFGFLGYLKVKKLRAPERTISSAKDTVSALKNRGGDTRHEA